MDVENVLEHTIRVVFLALLIARKEGVKNEEKIMKMALVHDLPETRATDLMYVHKKYASRDEKKAAHDLFVGTAFDDMPGDIFHEYEERKTIESKIVKDADLLEVDLEMKELEARGSSVRKKMALSRKIVRDTKLHTKTAKEIWYAIQKADVHGWHTDADTWFRAGGLKNKK